MSKNDSFSLGDAVWSRNGYDEISRTSFMTIYSLATLFGLAVTAVISQYTLSWVHVIGAKMEYVGPINLWVLMIGTLVLGILGVIIALRYEQPIISFLGYMMIAVPFGLILGPALAPYTAESIGKILVLTLLITIVMSVIGIVTARSLEGWSWWLFSGLTFLIICQFGLIFLKAIGLPLPFDTSMHWLDWFGVALFSAYIVFDINRAKFVPATVDNAIDCAVALYLDIINLFLKLLQAMGKKK